MTPIPQRQQDHHDGAAGSAAPDHWIFGYGSLIWRPDFRWLDARSASVDGWVRRFWQGSHDHRGSVQAPGRVATLVPMPGQHCSGTAYRIDSATWQDVVEQLDHREQNGYERITLTLQFDAESSVEGITYIAAAGNSAWLGEASMETMARQIATLRGPSGTNRDYLLNLADALALRGFEDAHVAALASRVRAIEADTDSQ